jgi:hypothetical protein
MILLEKAKKYMHSVNRTGGDFMKKVITLSLIAGFVMMVASSGSVEAATCAKGGTKIGVINSNTFFGSQSSFAFNGTGGNGASGNIFGGNITTAPATSTSNQSMVANSNTTTVTTTNGGATNNVSLVNTGSFVNVCAGAAN